MLPPTQLSLVSIRFQYKISFVRYVFFYFLLTFKVPIEVRHDKMYTENYKTWQLKSFVKSDNFQTWQHTYKNTRKTYRETYMTTCYLITWQPTEITTLEYKNIQTWHLRQTINRLGNSHTVQLTDMTSHRHDN